MQGAHHGSNPVFFPQHSHLNSISSASCPSLPITLLSNPASFPWKFLYCLLYNKFSITSARKTNKNTCTYPCTKYLHTCKADSWEIRSVTPHCHQVHSGSHPNATLPSGGHRTEQSFSAHWASSEASRKTPGPSVNRLDTSPSSQNSLCEQSLPSPCGPHPPPAWNEEGWLSQCLKCWPVDHLCQNSLRCLLKIQMPGSNLTYTSGT